MKDQKKLIEIIEKYGVEPYKKSLTEEIQLSIRLKTTGISCNELGKTKLGGCPDLSKNTSWAKSKFYSNHLSFLGQINLEEIKELDENNLLPQKGMLYFFFNLDSGDDGIVLFSTDVDELEKAVPPEEFKEVKKSFLNRILTGKSKKRILKESTVEIYKEYEFPSWNSLRLERIQKITGTEINPIDAFEHGIIEDSFEDGETETTSNHHLLGNYKGIQNEYHELEFINFEITNFENLTISQIEEALKWKLLFQISSDNIIDLNYGDCGRILFFIHEDDLKSQNFENIKISVDSY